MKRIYLYIGLIFAFSSGVFADSAIIKNISYTANEDAYAKERCKLDILHPKNAKGFATFVFFHGGGITGGEKKFYVKEMAEKNNIAIVAPNYRLSPKIKAHEAIDDAAEAVAWVFKNIEKYGGDPDKIFVGGGSAGAYLTCMIALNSKYLQKHGVDNLKIAGIIPISGQMTTHFQVRKDLKYPKNQYVPIIDELAPLHYVENKMPPVMIVTGDRNLEFPERVEENLLFVAAVKQLKSSPLIEFYEMQGLSHPEAGSAADRPMKRFIEKVLKERKK